MLSKITKAAFEGKLVRKTIDFVLKKLDWLIGTIVRFIYAKGAKLDDRKILFIPFQGDYTCNPKYIAEELLRRDTGLTLVFSARLASMRKEGAYPEKIQLVEQYTMDYYKQIATAKMIVANSVEFLKNPTPIKKGQILIETWHGSLGIKRFGEKENHGRAWVAAAKRNGKRADYIISNSTFEDGVYRETFWKNTPILQYGHPRNDILFNHDEGAANAVLEKILAGPPCGRKYVLYAPTFRDDHRLDFYDLDTTRLREALAKKFGGEWGVLVRLHPTVRKMASKLPEGLRNNGDEIIDVTSYPDIQELMLVSSLAITDYSSWIYDFMLTGRPGFIYAPDIAMYEGERGFYYPLSSTPFPIASDNDGMIRNIEAFDGEKYGAELKRFIEGKGCMEDGHASARTADKIQELMG